MGEATPPKLHAIWMRPLARARSLRRIQFAKAQANVGNAHASAIPRRKRRIISVTPGFRNFPVTFVLIAATNAVRIAQEIPAIFMVLYGPSRSANQPLGISPSV